MICAVISPVLVFSQYRPLLKIFRKRHSDTRIIASAMVSSSQIRERIAQFLDGQIDLENFEDWIIQNTWNIHLSGSVAAESLTFAIEESLSEYSSNHINESELRGELLDILDSGNIFVQIADPPHAAHPRKVYRFMGSSPLVFASIRA